MTRKLDESSDSLRPGLDPSFDLFKGLYRQPIYIFVFGHPVALVLVQVRFSVLCLVLFQDLVRTTRPSPTRFPEAFMYIAYA